ncbi:hypothetical protein DWB85_01615 [Seongchinamella sediminis]|uniref:Uncharacterized protein n=1 Tax=Seongchinamella sediminis TaxID=2283635 RepID=A0A3L7E0H7_9GAMM|nr:hypothetical protein [Seongchinamella sediminis]RLQ23278.1 hypothetical protein DWB85_01615 [Seongchinamella sediminis]
MLSINKLEKVIELEETLRAEYEGKLEAAQAELEQVKQAQAEQQEQLQATIDQQLETIQELTTKATDNQKVEHQNRELTNRSENQQEQIATLKQRVKALQKDLANEREQLKELSQYDPRRMKKNLDANKKKLAEKTRANELLQTSLKQIKGEKLKAERKVQELEQELEGLKADLQPEEKAA